MTKNKIIRILPWTLLTLGYVSAVMSYGALVTTGLPLADEWRWLENLLLPFERGDISFFRYLTGEYSFLGHTHFLTLLFLLAISKFFNLQLSLLAYFGLLFYLAGWVLILIYILRQKSHSTSFVGLIILAASSVYFAPATDFPWLLVVFEYFYYFGLVLLIFLASLKINGKLSDLSWACLCFAAAFVLESFGAVAILSIVLASLVVCQRFNVWVRFALLTLGSYFFAWVLMLAFLGPGLGTSSAGRLANLSALIGNPLDLGYSILISLALPVVDYQIIRHYFGESSSLVQVVVGLIGLIFVLYTAHKFKGVDNKHEYFIPMAFFAVAVVAWFLIVTTRYLDFGASELNSRRFLRFYVFYYLGCILFFLKSGLFRFGFVVFSFTFFAMALGSILFLYKYRDGVDSYFSELGVLVSERKIDDNALGAKLWQCKDSYCTATIYELRNKGVQWVSERGVNK